MKPLKVGYTEKHEICFNLLFIQILRIKGNLFPYKLSSNLLQYLFALLIRSLHFILNHITRQDVIQKIYMITLYVWIVSFNSPHQHASLFPGESHLLI